MAAQLLHCRGVLHATSQTRTTNKEELSEGYAGINRWFSQPIWKRTEESPRYLQPHPIPTKHSEGVTLLLQLVYGQDHDVPKVCGASGESADW